MYAGDCGTRMNGENCGFRFGKLLRRDYPFFFFTMGGQKYLATRVVVIPDYLFDRLMSEDNGENLIALWIRYARQARMQNGEETKSYDSFMRKQL